MASMAEATTESARDLQHMVGGLRLRVSELESVLAGPVAPSQADLENRPAAPDDADRIIATIEDLHRELDAVLAVKKSLETDLAVANSRQAAQQAVCTELTARVEILEADAVAGGQLREQLSAVEKEHAETACRLEQALSQLENVSQERDRLARQRTQAESCNGEIKATLMDLEAKVACLERAAAEMGELRKELSAARSESRRFQEADQSLQDKLGAMEITSKTQEQELAATRELVRTLNKRTSELKKSRAAAEVNLADLGAQLGRREAENANLVDSNRHAEHKLKTMNARLESMKKELDLRRQALRDIYAATMRASPRIRKRDSRA